MKPDKKYVVTVDVVVYAKNKNKAHDLVMEQLLRTDCRCEEYCHGCDSLVQNYNELTKIIQINEMK